VPHRADADTVAALARMERRERRRLLRTVDAFVNDDAPVGRDAASGFGNVSTSTASPPPSRS
jgi:hypothetical protein